MAVLLVAVLAGCAAVENTAQMVLASRTGAIAVLGERLLEGEATYNQSRSGTIDLHSLEGPPLACFGALHLTATTGGVASLTCSDGQTATVPFELLGALRAAGRGTVGDTPIALTYGLSPMLAGPYLGVGVERLVREKP